MFFYTYVYGILPNKDLFVVFRRYMPSRKCLEYRYIDRWTGQDRTGQDRIDWIVDWIDRIDWMDGWTDGRTDQQTDRQTDKQTDRQIDR